MLPQTKVLKKSGKSFLFFAVFLVFVNGAHAQSLFPLTDFWTLGAGLGMSDILVDGTSYQIILEPKLSLTPAMMIGARFGANYSSEDDSRNILTFETQAFFRWNFLRLGNQENPVNIFIQGGMGLLAAYRGSPENTSVFGDVTMTRGSLLFDAAAGVTIPITERWNIEPSIRTGYPHIIGFSLTVGHKFHLPQRERIVRAAARVEYVEVIRTLPPNEIVRRVMISAVEFILFGPDIGSYNVGIDYDAQQLNELVLDYTAHTLISNPNYRVRIEGHANPYTISVSEIDELQTLSAMRSNVVAEQLRQRGVSDEQMVIVAFGGTRTATTEWDVRNRNRRVELILVQIDTN